MANVRVHFLGVIALVLLCGFLTQGDEGSSADLESDVFQPPSNVVDLDLDTFQVTVDGEDHIVVEFFAPWFLKKLKAKKIIAARFDADKAENKPISHAYNVSAYPTVGMFSKGKWFEYTGNLDADSVLDFVDRKSRPAVVDLKEQSIEKIREWAKGDLVSCIGIFYSKALPEYHKFVAIAEELKEEYLFGFITHPSEAIQQEFDVKPHWQVVVLKPWDEKQVSFRKYPSDTLDTLKNFLAVHKFPLVGEINRSNHKRYIDSTIPLAFIFVSDDIQRRGMSEIFKPVAMGCRNRLNFVLIDWEKYGAQARKLGLSGNVVPSFAIENTTSKLHYAFPEDTKITTDHIKIFVDQYFSGEGHVKTVVRHNYREVVYDSNNDVFLEYYAPWCGHCRALKPTWEKLAEELKDTQGIVIGKIDATKNDLPDAHKVHMYPTIRLFKKNDKENPVVFDSRDKSINTLIKFLNDNGVELPTGLVEQYKVEEAQSQPKDEL